MDIEGMGDATVNQLVDASLIADYGDIYYLDFARVKEMERMAEKSAQNLIDAIEKSRANDFNRLIYALGIRHVGEHTAWLLAGHFGSIDDISGAGLETLTAIEGIGPVMAESICSFFRNKENLKILKKLKSAGVRMTGARSKINRAAGQLSGKTIVLTGSLKSFTRHEAMEIIMRLGGRASSSVSKNTDFVVAGDEAGSKLEDAKKMGVKIIGEEEFKKLVERP